MNTNLAELLWEVLFGEMASSSLTMFSMLCPLADCVPEQQTPLYAESRICEDTSKVYDASWKCTHWMSPAPKHEKMTKHGPSIRPFENNRKSGTSNAGDGRQTKISIHFGSQT
ncbi:hypothetical protein BDZ94DRAFT_1260691 [Collybia nuda]|uniref:Uncharacterized protein n=1 Tax=Collybia nuda TaxID=64659 RepID=A0A9P5Y7T9_9AGAR|nr:hypothetical protein BDZ94DRAFT_1260691 [Collybia nuda]